MYTNEADTLSTLSLDRSKILEHLKAVEPSVEISFKDYILQRFLILFSLPIEQLTATNKELFS